MPWPISDTHWPRYLEPWFLTVMMLGQLLFLLQLLGGGDLADPRVAMLLIGLPLLTLAMARAAHHYRSRCAHMLLLMVIMGHAGMLLGSLIDFGALGPITLTSWCSSLPGFHLDALWTKLGVAPWSYAGMLLGSNVGMLISTVLFKPRRRRGMKNRWLYPVCNLGMVSGMLMMEVLLAVPAQNPAAAVVTMILFMLFGMSAGMLLGWQLAEQLYRFSEKSGKIIRFMNATGS